MMRAVAVPLLLALLAAVRGQDEAKTPEITLPNGSRLSGHAKYTTLPSNKPILSYQGIPFAKPPVGNLRYAMPLEAPKWDGMLEATTQYKCSQVDFLTYEYLGVEDCLYLNVYIPGKKIPSEPLPVMVWIHGGGFFAGDGTSDLYGPGRIMEKENVILVNINYRLGSLGFLSMEDNQMPSNLGFWDQNLALKWVQKNIGAFGGDPKKVTIFGESAGSVCVLAHMLSPQSKGLFHAAIAESGSPMSVFARQDRKPAYYARSLAYDMGCNPEGTSKEIRDCLLQKDVEDIASVYVVDEAMKGLGPLVHTPVVDGKFIPKEPWDMLNEGNFNQVPIIMGYNRDEGLLLTWNFLKDKDKLNDFNSDIEKNLLSIAFGRHKELVTEEELKLGKKLFQDFLGGKKLGEVRNQEWKKLEEIIADTWFNAIGMKTIEMLASNNKAPVYEYFYHHEGSSSLVDFQLWSPWKILARMAGRYVGLNLFQDPLGVSHFDEVMMIFEGKALPYSTIFGQEDEDTSNNMLDLWTNFAVSAGDPTPKGKEVLGVKWEKVDPKNPKRLNISDKLSFGPRSEAERKRLNFWNKVWEEFPPGVHEHSTKTYQETAKKYFKGKGEASTTKQEL